MGSGPWSLGANVVVVNSQTVRSRLAQHWGVEAEVLYPPHGADLGAEQEPVPGVEPGYLLRRRLLAHKRVDIVPRPWSSCLTSGSSWGTVRRPGRCD